MLDPNSISVHRLRALLNGVIIGIGIVSLLAEPFFGVLFIGIGVGFEYWHRQRIKRGQ